MKFLTQHFSLDEFTRSQEATRLGIANNVPDNLMDEAHDTARLLERIREYLCHLSGRYIPIKITSGYRCLNLNRAIGSADTSDHILAMAADFEAEAFGTPTRIAETLASQVSNLGIGQLINEYPDRNGWVHVSTKPVTKAVNRIITITGAGTFPGVRAA